MKAEKLSSNFETYIGRVQDETIDLIRQLCAIPAPSHREERRAQFIRDWCQKRGLQASVDDALNVLIPIGLDEYEDIVVITAHTDTVFPDMEPMPMRQEGTRLYCPGVGDDTANVAAMLMLADYLKAHKPRCGVLFAANSCEEGLGNLKGCKAIMSAFGARVKAFVSLDGESDCVCARAVGSSRYRISVKTQGGHSFSDFGRRNAIAVLSGLVCALYAQGVPGKEGCHTTYNVGVIEGGTSVNTIAQQASMLYEYRSDDAQCLAVMEAQMRDTLARHMPDDAQLDVQLLGLRPCAGCVDPSAQTDLENAAMQALREYAKANPALVAGSTDCNIPLSMGIPSVCFGVYRGEGAHTRGEWIDLASLEDGMKAAASLMLNWFEEV